jgi:hypothetical protein
VLAKFVLDVSLATEIGSPVVIAFVVFCLVGLMTGRGKTEKTYGKR